MNTAGYVRVSAQRQSQAQTLDQQLARRRAHLAAQGEARQSAQSFREAGDSGASLKRPGRAHLRDALKDRCVDHSRVTTPERRARNSVHPMGRLEALAHLGGPGEFRERAMRQDPHDPWLVQIRSVVAASERTRRAERRRRGRPMKRRAGLLLPWTTTPSGDRVAPERPRDPAGVHIDPAAGAVVQALGTRDLEGPETMRGLGKSRLQLGLPAPRGRARGSAASVRGLLTKGLPSS